MVTHMSTLRDMLHEFPVLHRVDLILIIQLGNQFSETKKEAMAQVGAEGMYAMIQA